MPVVLLLDSTALPAAVHRYGSGLRYEVGCPPDLARLIWVPPAVPGAGVVRARWWGDPARIPGDLAPLALPLTEIPEGGLLLPGDGDYDRPAPPPPAPDEVWRAALPEMIGAVDAETGRRALSGYEWPAGSGAVYSTSERAQLSTLGLQARIAAGSQPWPQSISRADGSVGELRDVEEGRAFVAAGLDAVASRLDYGRALRLVLLSAATEEDRAQARAWVAAYVSGQTPDLGVK